MLALHYLVLYPAPEGRLECFLCLPLWLQAARSTSTRHSLPPPEYANMGAADFVRNLVLGSFRQEEAAVVM